MPRNSSGTYSLPAGNPVVTGTTISSTWANSTLTDIANSLTDSLSRSGDGGMSASLALANGVIGAPGLSWGNESTSGLYRAAAGDFRYSISSTDKLQITVNGLRVADGALATPALSFISDTNTGLYSAAADDMRVVAGGTLVTTFTASGQAGLFQNGLVGTPSFSFLSDPDTGLYRIGADQLGISVGGGLRLTLSATQIISTSQVLVPDGLIGTLGLAFNGQATTGLFRNASGDMRFVGAGSLIMAARSTDLNMGVPIMSAKVLGSDGAVGAPEFSFAADTNTGFYRDTADQIAIALGGVTAGQIAQGSYTGTLTGCTTSPTTTVTYQRVGKLVILSIPNVTGTSNSTALTLTGAPAVIVPAGLTKFTAVSGFIQNGAADDGVTHQATMNAAGTIEFYRGGSSIGWTAVGTKGIDTLGCSFAYLLN